ncbi:MAG: heme ABC exporter ATP-binding protein CcmA [Pseudomonadota bacterium]|nr:heme ABC exporter ATP-binding protein CcmA [Pseudomonadota bacterium]
MTSMPATQDGPFEGTGITCRRGGTRIFADIDFRLDAGDCLILRGSNGTGKTSLLRLMAGLAAPFAGYMDWSGVSIAADPRAHARRLVRIGHSDGIKSQMTAAMHLRFHALLWGIDEARVRIALEGMGIEHLAETEGRKLSAGQRRRLDLARLLLEPRSLWLLDEPFAGLDGDGRALLHDAIADHRAGGGRVSLALNDGNAPSCSDVLDLDGDSS